MDLPARRLPLAHAPVIDPARPRSAGPLDADALAACRAAAVPLAYDPLQHGWIPLACADDLATCAAEGDILLRPWRLDDLPTFVALLDDPRVWRHLPETYPAPLTEAIARDLIEIAREGTHHEVRAIVVEGAPVGQVRLAFDPDEGRRRAEIGYWLGASHWARGIAGDAVALATRHAFAAHGELATLFAIVHADNHASLKVLEKAGYARAGTAPRGGDRLVLEIARDGVRTS